MRAVQMFLPPILRHRAISKALAALSPVSPPPTSPPPDTSTSPATISLTPPAPSTRHRASARSSSRTTSRTSPTCLHHSSICASPHHRLSRSDLKAERPIPGNSIQITGGEPMLREDIADVIKIMKEEGVDHVQMNTNCIRHAMDPEAAREVRLAGCNNLYLSFDGVTARTNPKKRYRLLHPASL